MAATIWTNEAQRHAAWRVLDAPKGHGATQFVPGTSVNQHAPDGPAEGLLWPVCVQRSIFAIPQRQLASFVQASSKFAGTSFGELTLWYRGVDLTIAFKMPEGAKSNVLTKPVTGAKMKCCGRLWPSRGTDVADITTCPSRGEVSAMLAAAREEGTHLPGRQLSPPWNHSIHKRSKMDFGTYDEHENDYSPVSPTRPGHEECGRGQVEETATCTSDQ